MTAVAKRSSTRLCAEPGCGEVGVDAPGGWCCAEHARAPWDRWRACNPGRSSYGSRWQRLHQLKNAPRYNGSRGQTYPVAIQHRLNKRERRTALYCRKAAWR